MASSGMLRRVALVRTDVSEEHNTSFIRVTRIGELGTTLAVTSNRRTLRRLLVTAKRVSRASGLRVPEDGCHWSRKCRILDVSRPYGLPRPHTQTALLL
jgi:hypothetical protein